LRHSIRTPTAPVNSNVKQHEHMPMHRTRPLATAAAIALLLALAFIFNPSAEKHRTAIKEAVADRSPLARVLGIGAIAAFVTTYHSWGICSYTTSNERTISIGAFGLVYVRDLLPSK
jgi:hypothetical protein